MDIILDCSDTSSQGSSDDSQSDLEQLRSQESNDDFSDLEQSLSNEDVDNDSNRLMDFGKNF